MASCEKWNKEMSREFSLYKRLMWPLGSWPLDRSRNFANLRALFLTLTQAIMVIYISVDIINSKDFTLGVIIDHFVMGSCASLAIVKSTLIRLHRDNLSKNFGNAASDWTYIKKQDLRQVMFRYTNLARFVLFSQMGFSYFVTVLLLIRPLLFPMPLPPSQNVTLTMTSEKEIRNIELPYIMICPFDTQIACYSLYIFQMVQVISTATGNVGSDVFLFSVCMHLCGQLEVLGLELLRFHEGKENGYWKRTKMITLIERHCLLLNLAKDIVDMLNMIMVAQLILHALLVCIVGLQIILSLADHDFFHCMSGLTTFNIFMIQLFLYCYMGETLSSNTQAITRSIYFSKWYDLPTNVARDIRFITARSNVPVRIRAGKFYTIDFNSFTNVLKVSVSYFSVLKIIVT